MKPEDIPGLTDIFERCSEHHIALVLACFENLKQITAS
uniref:Uncharacterized protein n=1 Tax=Arundo donax TaxID=35708 RepID=A0A0A9GU34_ARUDO